MNSETTSRKSPRLKSFDYSSSRFYFITICTEGHNCLFGMVVRTKENGKMLLNDLGGLVRRNIIMIDERYEHIRLDKYVVMPNHIHMILELKNENRVSLAQVIGLFKSGVSSEAGFSVWQRSYYDHIIRGEADYIKIWTYIDNNPAQWAMDKYYR